MQPLDGHPTDGELLQEVDGELSASASSRVRAHLGVCWKCRARLQEVEAAIADFVRFHQRESEASLPSADGPRSLLKAHLARIAATPAGEPIRYRIGRDSWPVAAVACLLGVVAFLALPPLQSRRDRPPSPFAVVSVPDSTITPGATVLRSQGEVCSEEIPKNKAVPVTLQRKVFAAYGIPGAEPDAYEVDYLITPALGGADDIRNLWPQSYSATLWSAEVKDALEDRLRELVCSGNLDLNAAQREIAGDWVAAYKKYFHTDTPLDEHRHDRVRQ